MVRILSIVVLLDTSYSQEVRKKMFEKHSSLSKLVSAAAGPERAATMQRLDEEWGLVALNLQPDVAAKMACNEQHPLDVWIYLRTDFPTLGYLAAFLRSIVLAQASAERFVSFASKRNRQQERLGASPESFCHDVVCMYHKEKLGELVSCAAISRTAWSMRGQQAPTRVEPSRQQQVEPNQQQQVQQSKQRKLLQWQPLQLLHLRDCDGLLLHLRRDGPGAPITAASNSQ